MDKMNKPPVVYHKDFWGQESFHKTSQPARYLGQAGHWEKGAKKVGRVANRTRREAVGKVDGSDSN